MALLLACSAGSGDGRKLNVGQEPGPEGGGSAGFGSGAGQVGDGGIASGDNALTLHVNDINEMTITVITLRCAGDCADVEAVAIGGNPPYDLTWDDGSKAAVRRVCPDATSTFSVSVTDTAIVSEEFEYDAQTATAQVTAEVLDCSDGGAPDPIDECGPRGAMQAYKVLETLKPDIFGMPTYYAGGAALPAGKYRLTYVDGCLRYQGGGGPGPADDWTWTVHGTITYQFLIIGETQSQVLGMAPAGPGIVGAGTPSTPFEDCVATNRMAAPLELDFAGGRLGLWQNDWLASDNVPGPDGRTPTWELSRACD